MERHRKQLVHSLILAAALIAAVATFLLPAALQGQTQAQPTGIDPIQLAKAKAGDVDAEFHIAMSYAKQGNHKESHRWYLMAAQNGNVIAMTIIAADYQFGRNVARNDGLAFNWYRNAANKGNLLAITNLGDLYERGAGVQKDLTQAMTWYLKAADQNYAMAEHYIGLMYLNGNGIQQDYVQAAKWSRKAAEQGLFVSQSLLGWLYENGHGVPQDYVEAAMWYHKAAEQGDALAQWSLSSLYESGKGVTQDYKDAYFWINLAAANNPEGVKQEDMDSFRDEIATHLMPADLSLVQDRARKWFENYHVQANPQ
jgi:TPR repeat protein